MSKDKAQYSSLSFNDLQGKIENFKEKRDSLNKKTREYIDRLGEIENEIIELLKTARDVYKPKRDHWNKKVKQLKEKKIEYKKYLDNFIGEKKRLKPQGNSGRASKSLISPKKLERRIDFLERVIETENLDISKENEIVDEIRKLEREKQEVLMAQKTDNAYKIERKIEIVKINLNKIYEQLNKWSSKSQKYHMKMLESYQKANELKENKKLMEEELIRNKKAADRYHSQYLEVINQKKRRTHKKSYKSGPRKQYKKVQRPKYIDKNRELLEKMKRDKLAIAIEKQKAGKKLNLYEARLILEQSGKGL